MASRFDYVQYDERATQLQARAKQLCTELEGVINETAAGRAGSLALTNLEVTYMWIGKAIRDNQIARGDPAPLQESRSNS